MKFYHYRQNNTGGGFDEDENLGQLVIVEASSIYEANGKASEIGIYFNGCDTGQDCPCCGDRWYSSPDVKDEIDTDYYVSEGSIRIHYANGTKEIR